MNIPEGLVVMTVAEATKNNGPYIDIYKPMAGYKCKLMMHFPPKGDEVEWMPDGMYDCQQTGFFGHATRKEAVQEAIHWCLAEEIPLVCSDLALL